MFTGKTGINWEEFKDVGSRFGKKGITVTRNNGFGFSTGLINDACLGDYDYVVLNFAKGRGGKAYVGFRFTKNKETKGAFKLLKKGKSAQVAVRSFFKKYTLNPNSLKGKYDIESVEETRGDKFVAIKIPYPQENV